MRDDPHREADLTFGGCGDPDCPTSGLSPYAQPPGPGRRRIMLAQGRNVAEMDYTAEELAEIECLSEAHGRAFDQMARDGGRKPNASPTEGATARS